jgi:alkylated DNA repair dioxygenase AlkB
MFRGSQQIALFAPEPLGARAPQQGSGADVHLIPEYLAVPDADRLLSLLEALPGWRQDYIRVYGKTHPLPRLHRWFADSGQPYRWSGIDMHPDAFPEPLQVTLRRLEVDSGVRFNTALGNLYGSGSDSVSWHSDDEPDLGPEPVIASLSLGATRRFLLRQKADHAATLSFELTHGSLLWMSGATQRIWEHCVPKTRRSVGRRINLTFRAIRS